MSESEKKSANLPGPTHFDDELMELLDEEIKAGRITVTMDSDPWFDLIWSRFPFIGSKIGWSKVPTAMTERLDRSNPDESVKGFLDKCLLAAETKEADQIVVVGDYATDITLVGEAGAIRRHLWSIVELPQHTYVLPIDGTWCACFSMEGDMDFGFSRGVPWTGEEPKMRKPSKRR